MEKRVRLPLVSVVLPTYNRLSYLREAVESVRAQTMPDWELIVLDDGSTDGTVEWLAGLDDPRVHIVTAPHSGRIPQLRNQAIAEARTDWIAFIDSDDTWAPDKLARQLAFHAEHPAIRWSYTGRAMMDGDGEALPDTRFKVWRPVSGNITAKLLEHEAKIALTSVFMHRTLLSELDGFDERLAFCSDYDLWLRAAQRTECGVLGMPLVRVRVHRGNTTRDHPEVNASFIDVYKKFGRASTSTEERRICRRQEAFYAVYLGRQLAARGEGRRALRAFVHGLRRRPWFLPAWKSLGWAIRAWLTKPSRS